MRNQLLPIIAIVLGSAFLMLAGGIHGLLLPLRGAQEGFTTLSLGLLGTGWSIGFIASCLYTPQLVRRVGHVRTFGMMASICVIVVLLMLLSIHPVSWVILRCLTGFCFAGAAMIVESWLNERTEAQYRGRIFAIYMMVNLAAIMIGQMIIPLGSVADFTFFVVAAIFYALAVIPTAISTASAPKPLVEAGLDLKAIYRNSPIAFIGAFMIGVTNSSFGTLGAVFGNNLGMGSANIALMMSLPIFIGAVMQIPIGYLSDKMDRRIVLLIVTAVALSIDGLLIVAAPQSTQIVLATIAVFGGAIYAAYPIVVAHASDKAQPDTFIKISGGLLLMYGVGGVIGPLLSGFLMSILPTSGLFVTTFFAHLTVLIYGIVRIFSRDAVAEEDKSDYVGMLPGRFSTPETSTLDPRSHSAETGEWGEPIAPEDQD